MVAAVSITSSTAPRLHPGLSAADLTAVPMGRHPRYDRKVSDDLDADHLVFSEGHAFPLPYAMGKAAGAIGDEESTTPCRRFGHRLQGHPTPDLPWGDSATGPPGQGVAYAAGIAPAGRDLAGCTALFRHPLTVPAYERALRACTGELPGLGGPTVEDVEQGAGTIPAPAGVCRTAAASGPPTAARRSRHFRTGQEPSPSNRANRRSGRRLNPCPNRATCTYRSFTSFTVSNKSLKEVHSRREHSLTLP
ncbi:hypothetical protein ACWEO1_24890 [Kitasatospora cineracea]